MKREIPPDRLLTVREVAARWQVSERTVKRRIHAGDLKAIRVGHQMRVQLAEVRNFETRNVW